MFNWNNKKVLVTGAGGFIGSHLTEKLVALGANVRCFVRYNSRNSWGFLDSMDNETLNSIEVYVGDLKDPQAVRSAVCECQIVFHLGALIAIPYSYVNPMDFVQTNICGTANILNACRDFNVEKLIQTSTSEVYGSALYAPIDEKHPKQSQSPYSASKIGADKLALSYHLSFDLPVSVIRPFNTYGPRQSARAVIPTIITQALQDKENITLGSLDPTRDLTFVSDTVEGFIKTAESPKSVGEEINLGVGKEISIGDLADKIVSLTGSKAQIKTDPKRIRPGKSEVVRLVSDNSKAYKLIGWQPETTLDEGIKKTIEWIKKNSDIFKSGMYNI